MVLNERQVRCLEYFNWLLKEWRPGKNHNGLVGTRQDFIELLENQLICPRQGSEFTVYAQRRVEGWLYGEGERPSDSEFRYKLTREGAQALAEAKAPKRAPVTVWNVLMKEE